MHTVHASLRWLMQSRKLRDTLTQWRLFLKALLFDFQYCECYLNNQTQALLRSRTLCEAIVPSKKGFLSVSSIPRTMVAMTSWRSPPYCSLLLPRMQNLWSFRSVIGNCIWSKATTSSAKPRSLVLTKGTNISFTSSSEEILCRFTDGDKQFVIQRFLRQRIL